MKYLLLAIVSCLLVPICRAQINATWDAQDASIKQFAAEVTKIPKRKDGTSALVGWPVYERMGTRFVAGYLFDAADAAPSRGYAALDSDDGRLSIGYTMRAITGEEQLKMLVTLGLKMNVSDGFATIASEGKGMRDDIGGQLKFTFIGDPGLLYDTPKHQDAVQRYQDYRVGMMTGALEDWIDEDRSVRRKKGLTDDSERATELEEKKAELKEELLADMVERLESGKLYNAIWNWWATGELYMPISPTSIMVADSAAQPTPRSFSTYPLTASVRGFAALKTSEGQSVLGSIGFSIMNNNSALARELETMPFLSTVARPGADTMRTSVVGSEDVYVLKDLVSFVSPAIELGIVGGPFSCAPGFRIRFSWQEYLRWWGNEFTPTIWTIGLPLTLKDKDGDPTINVEPQLRWLNDERSFGLSVGLPLGTKL
ncbi:MAG: hypothetical protein IPN62_02520 [Flavobacteriales bacterium]|nr:hypothetical protein [Flavobacteriales bacterium]